jgi:hypothetical protein
MPKDGLYLNMRNSFCILSKRVTGGMMANSKRRVRGQRNFRLARQTLDAYAENVRFLAQTT